MSTWLQVSLWIGTTDAQQSIGIATAIDMMLGRNGLLDGIVDVATTTRSARFVNPTKTVPTSENSTRHLRKVAILLKNTKAESASFCYRHCYYYCLSFVNFIGCDFDVGFTSFQRALDGFPPTCVPFRSSL